MPAGVVAITPTTAIWALDKKYKQVRVKRKGFTVASDFSGTAHSFAGATLRAAIVDCLPWNHQPSTEDQLMAYMCLSRVERIDDICVVAPFSPALFAGGDLPGPEILLRFQRGEIEQSHLERTWAGRTSARKVIKATDWEQTMPLYCRSCSVKARKDMWKPLKDWDKLGIVMKINECISHVCKRISRTELFWPSCHSVRKWLGCIVRAPEKRPIEKIFG